MIKGEKQGHRLYLLIEDITAKQNSQQGWFCQLWKSTSYEDLHCIPLADEPPMQLFPFRFSRACNSITLQPVAKSHLASPAPTLQQTEIPRDTATLLRITIPTPIVYVQVGMASNASILQAQLPQYILPFWSTKNWQWLKTRIVTYPKITVDHSGLFSLWEVASPWMLQPAHTHHEHEKFSLCIHSQVLTSHEARWK